MFAFSGINDHNKFWLSCSVSLWFSSFQRLMHYLAFKSFDFEPTGRRSFQKRVMHTLILNRYLRFICSVKLISFCSWIRDLSHATVSFEYSLAIYCQHYYCLCMTYITKFSLLYFFDDYSYLYLSHSNDRIFLFLFNDDATCIRS